MALSKSVPLEIIPSLILQGTVTTGQDVIVSGHYAGELKTQGELTVLGSGKISGKLQTQALTIDIGGEMDADIVVGQKPLKKMVKEPGSDGRA